MGKRREYKFECFFEYPDGRTVPLDSIGEEERTEINKEWVRRWERITRSEISKNPEAYRNAMMATTQEDIDEYYSLFPEKYAEHLKKNCVAKPCAAG